MSAGLPAGFSVGEGTTKLTSIKRTTYQRAQTQPQGYPEVRVQRIIKSDQPPYIRPGAEVGQDWEPLDLGWLKDKEISCIQVFNEEGRFLTQQPTDGERSTVLARVLEVAYEGSIGGFKVEPQQEQEMCPTHPRALRIRCLSSTAKYTLRVFPA